LLADMMDLVMFRGDDLERAQHTAEGGRFRRFRRITRLAQTHGVIGDGTYDGGCGWVVRGAVISRRQDGLHRLAGVIACQGLPAAEWIEDKVRRVVPHMDGRPAPAHANDRPRSELLIELHACAA